VIGLGLVVLAVQLFLHLRLHIVYLAFLFFALPRHRYSLLHSRIID
jgi:hypothetical protein